MASIINPSSSNPIPTTYFAKAIKSLLEFVKGINSKLEKSKLFEADDLIYLLLTLKSIPTKEKTNPYRIPIPNPFHEFKSGSTSICLILDDTDKSPLQPEAAREVIKARDLPIDHVIGLWELKSDYKAYESRRKLCNSYDMFFADRRILPMLPRFIGKQFFKTKKLPLAVDFSRVGWPDQIKAACESTLMYMKTGTSVALKIGRVGMSEEDILENALAVIERAVEHVPKKWGGLRSVHIKTGNSVALPIYQVVPEVGLKIEGVWDVEKKKRLAEGKKKRERDGDGKKERKAKKGRIGDVNGLDEAIDDEVGTKNSDDEVTVENGDGDEKVEEEDNEIKAKMKKGKKRKMGIEKSDELEGKEVLKRKGIKGEKAGGIEISKKKKGNKTDKVESEASKKKKGNEEKQLKKKKAKKINDMKKVEEVVDEPKKVEGEKVESEARKKGNDKKQIKKMKVKQCDDSKKVKVVDEPKEFVFSDSAGKKKKPAKMSKTSKPKNDAKSG